MNHHSKQVVCRIIIFVLFSAWMSACAPDLRSIPVRSPALGVLDPTELRIPNPDSRTQRICTANLATDCLDWFWRIERANDKQVAFRYRRVSMTQEDARASADQVSRMTLMTSDGRTCPGHLANRFDMEQLEPLEWSEDALVGDRRLVVDDEGYVRAQKEVKKIQVHKITTRFSGSSFVIFNCERLISADTSWIELVFPGGLLGGGGRWRWTFDGGEPVNATLSTDPLHDRPDLSRFGTQVHR